MQKYSFFSLIQQTTGSVQNGSNEHEISVAVVFEVLAAVGNDSAKEVAAKSSEDRACLVVSRVRGCWSVKTGGKTI